ncbi:MAG TPA: HAD family phosphatase [Candidatus Baltobacteraceae bacterium]|nr:HAD family phosphatase [Candidatus Baltobacteraceae bacterium]
MKSSCVIFDLDGTLVESEQVWRDVRRDLVTGFGLRWSDGAQEAMMGMRTSEWSRYMHETLGVPLDETAIADRVIGEVAERLSADAPIIPGAADALNALAAAYPLALATSAARAVAGAVLDAAGWAPYFEIVVSADEVERGKPAPEVYLHTLELMGADPRRCAAIEDSANGIRSASAAGLAVVAIPNRAFPPSQSALSLADRVLDGIGELTAQTIAGVLSASDRPRKAGLQRGS